MAAKEIVGCLSKKLVADATGHPIETMFAIRETHQASLNAGRHSPRRQS
jgi:hypothetical protein